MILSQEIKVYDSETLEGIIDVRIKTKNQIYSTDKKGKVTINKLDKNEILIFSHPEYEQIKLSIDTLIINHYKVYLREKILGLDEVIISAGKFEEKAKDLVQSIQLLKKKELENMNQSSTADVLSHSGKIMVQKSQLGGGSPIIRGFETNKVLIVVDGVRMNNAIYRSGHVQNVITLDNSIMEKIEIVYGPGSTIYGSDALGGVMHFYTKKPAFAKSDTLLVKSGTYLRYMSAANAYSGHLDFSLAKKKLASFTSFSYSNFGDLRQGANRNNEYGNFGARTWYVKNFNGKDSVVQNHDSNVQLGSGYSQYDLLQKILYKQSEKVLHQFNIQYSNSSNIPRYDRLTQMLNGLPKYGEWYYGPQKRFLFAYNLELNRITKIYDKVKSVFSYQQIEESRIDRKFNNPLKNNRIEKLDIFSFNLDLLKKIDKNELKYGFEFWYNKVNSSAYSQNIFSGEKTPLDTRYASGGSLMYSASVYLTHQIPLGEKFILSEGLRFTYVGLMAKFTDTTFFKFPFKEAIQKNSAFSGNIGLIYSPTKNSRLNLLFSSGYRVPNIDDLSKVFESTAGNIYVPNTNLKPEYVYNSELGFSQTIGKKILFSTTVYYTWYINALTVSDYQYNNQDSIFYEGVLSKVVATTNAKRAYLYGVECSLSAPLNNIISIYGTYNYTYARIVTDSVELPLDHIPPAFGKVGFQLTKKSLKADFFVQYSFWKRIADYNPNGEDNQAYALPEGMPAWFTLNARVSYQFNKFLGLQVACENILDRNYRVFASNISAPGRNFIVTLRGNF